MGLRRDRMLSGRSDWSGQYPGWKSDAIGCYDGERIWNGAYKGWESDAVGSYDGERIWADSTEGWESDAVGCYKGSPPGAVSAALVLLLGGGEASDSSGSESDDQNTDDSDDDDSDEHDSDDDDSESGGEAYDDSDSSSDYSANVPPPAPPPPPDPPEVVARRLFADAPTVDHVKMLRSQFASQLDAKLLEQISQSRLEILETARVDELIRKASGRSAASWKAQFDIELPRHAAEEKPGGVDSIESFQLFQFVALVEACEKKTESELLCEAEVWLEHYPVQGVLARRRLRRIYEQRAAEALAQIEPIDRASFRQLQHFFFQHRDTDTAIQALQRVVDKDYLRWAWLQSSHLDYAEKAKRRYRQVLDIQHSRRSFWERIHYNLIWRRNDYNGLDN